MRKLDKHREPHIHIACTSSGIYLPYCATMLRSVLTCNRQVTIHFLRGPSLTAEDLRPLADMVENLGGQFNALSVDEARLSRLPVLNYISEWYRILLPELLTNTSQVLYLDCDTFIVDTLAPLWNSDLDGCYVAAVEGVPAPGIEDVVRQARAQYFNSGVLLLNLDAMRDDGMTDRLADCGRSQLGRVHRADQDILNMVLGDKRAHLHPRWNSQNTLFSERARALGTFSEREIAEATASPAILHFEGPGDCKPWHFLSRHPWTQAYRDTLAQTPWAGTPLWGKTVRNRVLAATLSPTRSRRVYARIELYKYRLGLPSDVL